MSGACRRRRLPSALLCASALHIGSGWSFPGGGRATTTSGETTRAVPCPMANRRDDDDDNNEAFPWFFRGRAIMRPALVRMDDEETTDLPPPLVVLSLFGWTLGGAVVLEYDESPVGPYREYVCLGGIAAAFYAGRFLLGQYGSSLYVNETKAEQLCQQVWNLTALPANIDLVPHASDSNKEEEDDDDDKAHFVVGGWSKLQNQHKDSQRNFHGLPLLWTPFLKAIWARLFLYDSSKTEAEDDHLPPLHRLRLSGKAQLLWNAFDIDSPNNTLPLGLDVAVQNALIEISPRIL